VSQGELDGLIEPEVLDVPEMSLDQLPNVHADLD
jgi:hypothetical protein